MVIIYDVETGEPRSIEHMIDAKEAVSNGSYSFVNPKAVAPKKEEPPAEKKTIVRPKKEKQPKKKSLSKPLSRVSKLSK